MTTTTSKIKDTGKAKGRSRDQRHGQQSAVGRPGTSSVVRAGVPVARSGRGRRVGRALRAGVVGVVAAVMAVGVDAGVAWAAPGDDGMARVRSFTEHLASYVTAIAATVAVLFIAINGVKYTTSGGNPGRQMEARNGLVAAGVGLAIALSARVLVGLVVSALR